MTTWTSVYPCPCGAGYTFEETREDDSMWSSSRSPDHVSYGVRCVECGKGRFIMGDKLVLDALHVPAADYAAQRAASDALHKIDSKIAGVKLELLRRFADTELRELNTKAAEWRWLQAHTRCYYSQATYTRNRRCSSFADMLYTFVPASLLLPDIDPALLARREAAAVVCTKADAVVAEKIRALRASGIPVLPPGAVAIDTYCGSSSKWDATPKASS